MNKTLKELRDLNSGANPEKINKEDILHLDEETLEDIEGHIYHKTNAISEVHYILTYPKNYGVEYNGSFYRLI